MGDIVVFGGSSHPELVDLICENLGVKRSTVELSKFSNGETNVQLGDSVREKDVYIIQSGCGHVNDNFIELLIMISACKSASASRVTAVLPYLCYSRQPDIPYTSKGAPLVVKANKNISVDGDILAPAPTSLITQRPGSMSPFQDIEDPLSGGRKSASRIPIVSSKKDRTGTVANEAYNSQNSGYKLWVAQSGTLIANLLTTSGADHIITMDLHDPQFPGFFSIPVDNLYCRPLIQNYIQHHIPNSKDAVIVSPDAGGAKRAIAIADGLELSFALIHKERRSQLLKGPPDATLTSGGSLNVSSNPLITNLDTHNSEENNNSKFIQTTMLVGDVRNKLCIIVDDLVDTSYTITRAAKLLKDQGASKVYAIATHGIFSGDALNHIARSDIDKFIVANTVSQDRTIAALGKDKVEIIDVSRVFGEAIRRIYNGESISMLFEHGW